MCDVAFKTPKRTSPLSQNLLDDSDLQNVQITLRVLYRPVIPKLPEIHMVRHTCFPFYVFMSCFTVPEFPGHSMVVKFVGPL